MRKIKQQRIVNRCLTYRLLSCAGRGRGIPSRIQAGQGERRRCEVAHLHIPRAFAEGGGHEGVYIQRLPRVRRNLVASDAEARDWWESAINQQNIGRVNQGQLWVELAHGLQHGVVTFIWISDDVCATLPFNPVLLIPESNLIPFRRRVAIYISGRGQRLLLRSGEGRAKVGADDIVFGTRAGRGAVQLQPSGRVVGGIRRGWLLDIQ